MTHFILYNFNEMSFKNKPFYCVSSFSIFCLAWEIFTLPGRHWAGRRGVCVGGGVATPPFLENVRNWNKTYSGRFFEPIQLVNFEFIWHKLYQTRFWWPSHSFVFFPVEHCIIMLNAITRPIISFTKVLCLYIGFCWQINPPPSHSKRPLHLKKF